MDLQALDTKEAADRGSWLHLRHPSTNAPLYADDEEQRPMRLRLLGSDSAAYQREQRKQQNAVLDARREGRSTRTAEELEDEALGLLIVCTDECENLVLDGEEIPCEPAELRAFYRRFSWAAEQAGAWIVRRGHYLGN